MKGLQRHIKRVITPWNRLQANLDCITRQLVELSKKQKEMSVLLKNPALSPKTIFSTAFMDNKAAELNDCFYRHFNRDGIPPLGLRVIAISISTSSLSSSCKSQCWTIMLSKSWLSSNAKWLPMQMRSPVPNGMNENLRFSCIKNRSGSNCSGCDQNSAWWWRLNMLNIASLPAFKK